MKPFLIIFLFVFAMAFSQCCRIKKEVGEMSQASIPNGLVFNPSELRTPETSDLDDNYALRQFFLKSSDANIRGKAEKHLYPDVSEMRTSTDVNVRALLRSSTNPGYFETYFPVSEIITLIILTLAMIPLATINQSNLMVKTFHLDVFSRPTGSSYTQIPRRGPPRSFPEARSLTVWFLVIYLLVRWTCLSGVFAAVYMAIGNLLDRVF